MPYIIDNTPKIDRWETKFKIYQWEESPLSFFQHLNCSKNAGFGIIAHLRTTPKLTNPSWQLQCCSGNQWSNLKWKKKKKSSQQTYYLVHIWHNFSSLSRLSMVQHTRQLCVYALAPGSKQILPTSHKYISVYSCSVSPLL